MLLIPCPWCGNRPEIEFAYGGEHAPGVEEGWQVANTAGRHAEEWVHQHGCRQRFVMERDTLTHEIFATRGLNER